jgi:hypothetical protein
MTIRGFRRAPRALAVALLLGGLCLVPIRAAHAAAGDGTDEGWKKVLKYARCVFNVFRAVTPADVMVAVFDCGMTYFDEAPGSGGAKP